MTWNGRGRKKYYPEICLKGLKKVRKILRVFGDPAEI
jgi:hypothetical protein